MTAPTIDSTSALQTGPQQTLTSTVDPKSLNGILGEFVNSNFKRLQNSRKATERQWYINLSFYFGKQYVVLQTTSTSTNAFRLYVPPAPPWRVRLTINKIRPIVRKEIAKLFGTKPRFDVAPSSTEDLDLVAARAGEQIFDYVYSAYDVQAILKQAGWWACITGTGFTKSYWDANKPDSSGTAGDFCIEAVSPFNLYVPDFTAISIESQPYVIHAMTKDMSWVKNEWPDLQGVNQTTQQILDDSFLDIRGSQNNNKNQVLVLEAWIKPGAHSKLPKGGLVTIVGGAVAQVVEEYPYKDMKFPFQKIDNIPSGKFYSASMVDDLIPLQKEYNRARSQIVESKNMLGKPKLLAQRGSVDPSKITSEPGQVILYQPGFQPPVPMQLPQLPQYIMDTIAQLDTDMLNISGQNDVTGGGQVTSATALSFLQEQDDTMLQDTTDSLEAAISKLGSSILSLVNQYWTEPRKIKVLGTDGAFDASAFSATDLRGNIDLRVEGGSALPKSLAAKQAFIMDLLKIGAIQPQDALEMLEIGGIEKIYDDFLADRNQAQRENLRMSAGVGMYVNEFDNHQKHIELHNKFRKGTTYEMLDHDQKVLYQNHVMAHQAALILSMNGDPTGSGQVPSELPATTQPLPDTDPGVGPSALPPSALAGAGPPGDPSIDPGTSGMLDGSF